jgi:hypothetical protein
VELVTETSEAGVTVPGGVEEIDANEVVVGDGGKLAVNVNPLTEGVASVSPILDRTIVVTKCSFGIVSPPHLGSWIDEGTYFLQAPAAIWKAAILVVSINPLDGRIPSSTCAERTGLMIRTHFLSQMAYNPVQYSSRSTEEEMHPDKNMQ